MDYMQIQRGFMVLVACSMITCYAYPLEVDDDDDPCAICFIDFNDKACDLCKIEHLTPEKRSGSVFHPFFRGAVYNKKSSYHFNPLIRGTYPKKSPYVPVYHPFLRGGYGGARLYVPETEK
ncbi:hypothetical protein DPMN_108987 [Dreissena polymorpha]|uniref:Uncharacterized protein n=1 Tax=Dreissena polymorpha TaxID=45954 RepID=A0A9D4K9V1_DREPO|nr:hypothetical protein DPMN_108987 [Dreissena polymorpha]